MQPRITHLDYRCKRFRSDVELCFEIRGTHRTRVKRLFIGCDKKCGENRCPFREKYYREITDDYLGKKDERKTVHT